MPKFDFDLGKGDYEGFDQNVKALTTMVGALRTSLPQDKKTEKKPEDQKVK